MRVAKWGNSLAIRLPASLAQTLDLHEGDDVDLRAGESGGVVVERKPDRLELIKSLREFRGRLPADLKFDRDEANER